nr:TMV resistance protein N-like [Ziziphus jujuba var. spinosa]
MEVKQLQSTPRSIWSPAHSDRLPKHLHLFLSFRGEDARKSFTDHLYEALNDDKGIYTFRDDKKLERGKDVAPELLKAIEESRFAILVFSKDYASSTWCLIELAKIVECKKNLGLTVLPVFYHVEPTDVRNQKGEFGNAFAKHEEEAVSEEDIRKVNKWREALTEDARISGWHNKEKEGR